MVEKQEIESEEFKKIQLGILDYIYQFCEEFGITFSLACGTLLGAIRHKGFIPWDDDIDIQMLREDYEKFIRLWLEYGDHKTYTLYSEQSNPIGIPYAKLSINNTILIEDLFPFPIGVNIDIFPIDEVVDYEDFIKRHNKVLSLNAKRATLSERLSNRNTVFQKIKLLLHKALLFPLTVNKVVSQISNISISKNSCGGEYLFEMCGGSQYNKYFRKISFSKTELKEFEGKLYPVLVGYDDYLRACYGDYMQLPPVEKRVTHHNFKVYWK